MTIEPTPRLHGTKRRADVYAPRRRRQSVRGATDPKPVPAGRSHAIDVLRATLAKSHEPELRQRLQAAVEHLERVVRGERVTPRDPAVRTRPRALSAMRRFNPTIEPRDPCRPTSKRQGTWMDSRLPLGEDD